MKTNAVLGFAAALVDVLVVVVAIMGLQSSRLSLGGGGDFLPLGDCAMAAARRGVVDVGASAAAGEAKGLDIVFNGGRGSWSEASDERRGRRTFSKSACLARAGQKAATNSEARRKRTKAQDRGGILLFRRIRAQTRWGGLGRKRHAGRGSRSKEG